MKARDIITQWRREVDDTVEPYLWEDDEVLQYLNDAEMQAARRLRFFLDSSTTEIVQAVCDTDGVVALDARVLFVRSCRIQGRMPLYMRTMQDMFDYSPMWQDDGAGSYPSVYIPDWETGKLRLHPKPSEERTVLMTVVRDPLAEMANMDSTPEIASRYHLELRHWLTHRAYMKPDQETYDPKKAMEGEERFARAFGPTSAPIDEVWNQRNAFDHDGTY